VSPRPSPELKAALAALPPVTSIAGEPTFPEADRPAIEAGQGAANHDGTP
jgi:hypothetical protein